MENFHDSASLVIADAWTSQRSDDSTVIITVKNKGTITLTEAWLLPTIVSSLAQVNHFNLMFNDGSRTFTGTSGNDYMWNDSNKVKVNGLAGDDYIETNNSQVTIDTGAGYDFVGNRGSNAHHVKIDGGNDDDLIYNYDGENVKINGGAGSDTVDNYGSRVTINGSDKTAAVT